VIVHQRLAVAVVILALAGTLWAAANTLRGAASPGLRAYLVLTEGIVVVQALVGVGLLIAGRRPHESLHYIYGPAVLLALPVAFVLRGREGSRGEPAALLGGSLGLLLLAIRAIATGSS
jgi:hypothetical protein